VGVTLTRDQGTKPPGGWPPHGSLTDIPLPSTGSPRYRFPGFNGTMKMCDSRRPSHRASFPSLGDTRRRACRFAPIDPERMTAGLEYIIRSPTPEIDAWRRYGPPKVPGEPLRAYALLSDPGETDTTATRPLRQVGTAPRTAYREGSPRFGNFGAPSHGISTRCLRFAVRISPHHARLASGCGPGSTRRDWLPAGFRRKVSEFEALSPFPSFPGARTVPFCSEDSAKLGQSPAVLR
jgi:hypothetical protein